MSFENFTVSLKQEIGPDSLGGNAAEPFWLVLIGTSELRDF